MSIRYVQAEEAIAADGLRMMVVGGVPSPWGEAAKGIFHVKNLPWLAVRLDYRNEALARWAGQQSGPVAVYAQEPPRAGWAEILLLAERLAPSPALLPADAGQRALVMGLSHEILGEQGLAWTRRLQQIQAGLDNRGGFAPKVAGYLAKKYGYLPDQRERNDARVHALLRMVAGRLSAQREAGSDYLVGDTLTALDIYLATTVALFVPLPAEVCDMQPALRAVFSQMDDATAASVDPVILAHRDRIYERHLALPLSL